MKQRKLVLISIMFTAICLFSSNAMAADNWQRYECTVVRVDVGTRYEFQLSCTNTNTIASTGGYTGPISSWWYEIHPDAIPLKKEILAIVLTAASLGKKVEVLLIPEIKQSIYAMSFKM